MTRATRRRWPAAPTAGTRWTGTRSSGRSPRARAPSSSAIPHNPTGRVFTRDELARMAEICLRRDLWIIADEIHCDLLFSGQRHVPIASLGPEVQARTITLMSPSKTFNLAGLKSAIAVVPDAACARSSWPPRWTWCRTPMSSASPPPSPPIATAVRGSTPSCATSKRIAISRSAYVREHFPGVGVCPPEGMYLAWLGFPAGGDSRQRSFHLLPREGARGAERRRDLRRRRPGVRAAQLRLAARHGHRGARPHARRASAPCSLTSRAGCRRPGARARVRSHPSADIPQGEPS